MCICLVAIWFFKIGVTILAVFVIVFSILAVLDNCSCLVVSLEVVIEYLPIKPFTLFSAPQ